MIARAHMCVCECHSSVRNGNCLGLHEIKFISVNVPFLASHSCNQCDRCVSFSVLGTHKLNSLNKYGDAMWIFFTGAFQFETFSAIHSAFSFYLNGKNKFFLYFPHPFAAQPKRPLLKWTRGHWKIMIATYHIN